MNNIISLDFDFWVDLLNADHHDWGAREAPFFINDIWPIRAISSLTCGVDLREECKIAKDEPHPSRFANILQDHNLQVKQIAVAESHSIGYSWLKRLKNLHIIHIDAHHDLGYTQIDHRRPMRLANIDCGNWLLALTQLGCVKKITIIYPKWRLRHDNEWEESCVRVVEAAGDTELEVHFGLVEHLPMDLNIRKMLVCRSGAWSPPWLDGDFQDLVFGLTSVSSDITFFGSSVGNTFDSMFERRIDWDEVEKNAAQEHILTTGVNHECKTGS